MGALCASFALSLPLTSALMSSEKKSVCRHTDGSPFGSVVLRIRRIPPQPAAFNGVFNDRLYAHRGWCWAAANAPPPHVPSPQCTPHSCPIMDAILLLGRFATFHPRRAAARCATEPQVHL